MKKKFLFFLNSALFILNCNAQWSSNPAVNNAICTATEDQVAPQLISDGTGGTIIIWGDYRNGSYDIYAQRIDANGVEQWLANGVAVCTAIGDQGAPQLISDGVGGAIITWRDGRIDLNNNDIYAQRINANGVGQWLATGVAVCTAIGSQGVPQLISDGSGGAIITWSDARSGTVLTSGDIYAQRINANGVGQWLANGVAVCTVTGNQGSPQLISDGSGGVIISWWDYRSGSSQVYVQRINANGVGQWLANGVAVCTAIGYQGAPQLISDGAGGVIISWVDNRSGNHDIYTQRINANGVGQWLANGVAVCTAIDNQDIPQLISDGAGGAIFTWEDLRSGSYHIYAQRINANGVVQWLANGVAVCTATYYQLSPLLISDGAGGAIITWEGIISVGTNDIYAQRINANGVEQWLANGVAVSTALNNQSYHQIISDGAGGAIFTWEDLRSGSSHIYAQNICADGSLGTCLTVGINEEENNSLTIYPNPTTSEINVNGYSPAYLKLCNMLGQTVAEATKTNKLYLGNLPQGLYVLQLFDEKGGLVKAEKVIVAE